MSAIYQWIGGKIDLEVPLGFPGVTKGANLCEVLDVPGYSIKQNSIAAYSSVS